MHTLLIIFAIVTLTRD